MDARRRSECRTREHKTIQYERAVAAREDADLQRTIAFDAVAHPAIEVAAAWIGAALDAFNAETTVAQTRTELARASDELRRLHSELASGSSNRDLDTALISHPLGVERGQHLLETESLHAGDGLCPLVGESPAMRAIVERLPRVAESHVSVLIVGESGVGKDLIARWLHASGPRRDLPFVAEVCNLSPNLVEAELFGFTAGSFTGATGDRAGLFERVSGGTVYLDEVTEMPPTLQAKILRVLEEKKVRAVGGDQSIEVDFRLVASSRQSRAALASGALLRRDLFYRIGTEIIEVPPLRERMEDLPALVESILDRLAAEAGKDRPWVHPDALAAWMRYGWPGNVRELENELARVLLEGPVEVTAEHVLRFAADDRTSPHVGNPSEELLTLKEARLRTEIELVTRALAQSGGNVTHAANAIGVTRRYLTSLVEKHGLSTKSSTVKKP